MSGHNWQNLDLRELSLKLGAQDAESLAVLLAKAYNGEADEDLTIAEQLAVINNHAQSLNNKTNQDIFIDFIESTANGSTPESVTGFTICFMGTGGTLKGVSVPDNFTASFGNGLGVIRNQISYNVPTSPGGRVLISNIKY